MVNYKFDSCKNLTSNRSWSNAEKSSQVEADLNKIMLAEMEV